MRTCENNVCGKRLLDRFCLLKQKYFMKLKKKQVSFYHLSASRKFDASCVSRRRPLRTLRPKYKIWFFRGAIFLRKLKYFNFWSTYVRKTIQTFSFKILQAHLFELGSHIFLEIRCHFILVLFTTLKIMHTWLELPAESDARRRACLSAGGLSLCCAL